MTSIFPKIKYIFVIVDFNSFLLDIFFIVLLINDVMKYYYTLNQNVVAVKELYS